MAIFIILINVIIIIMNSTIINFHLMLFLINQNMFRVQELIIVITIIIIPFPITIIITHYTTVFFPTNASVIETQHQLIQKLNIPSYQNMIMFVLHLLYSQVQPLTVEMQMKDVHLYLNG